MNANSKYKIKDSVDLFLSNERYIMAYYMNTRQRKSFKINEDTKYLLSIIDGERTLKEIEDEMLLTHCISPDNVERVICSLIDDRIITEILPESNAILDEKTRNRYTRQINYFAEFLDSEEAGLRAQKRLIDSKILILGAGAVGGDIAIELAMAGVENFTLFDFDSVSAADVSRHMYYRNSSDGMQKVEALSFELKKINRAAKVEILNQSMQPESDVEELIKSFDFVINTMDEPYIGYTSSKISRICVKHSIAHYIAGGFDAHLASTGEIIIPYITPCVECYAGHFKETLKGWKPEKHPVKNRFTEIGGLACLSLFSSSFACIEIIKYLAGLVSMDRSFKVRGEFLFHDMSLTYLKVEKNPNCPICGGVLLDET